MQTKPQHRKKTAPGMPQAGTAAPATAAARGAGGGSPGAGGAEGPGGTGWEPQTSAAKKTC